jgi:hypothetical protein
MKAVAVYACYSSELQSERSIDDQVALCRVYAECNDLTGTSHNARPLNSLKVKGPLVVIWC